MTEDWAKSAAGRRIIAHWADSRPAWFWSGDGSRLLWRNPAARLFNAKLKKSGLRPGDEPVPIKGQVPRLIRLGSVGRSSLSRVRFLAGSKPESRTCSVTPLETRDGTVALLIVGVDPIEAEVLAHRDLSDDSLAASLLPERARYLLVSPQGSLLGAPPSAQGRFEAAFAEGRIPIPESSAAVELDGDRLTLTRFKAGPGGEQLLLIEGAPQSESNIGSVRSEEGLETLEWTPPAEAPPADDPLAQHEKDEPAATARETAEERGEPEAAETAETGSTGPARPSLSSLFDRLAGTDTLFTELTSDDERFAGHPGTTDREEQVAPAGAGAGDRPAESEPSEQSSEGTDAEEAPDGWAEAVEDDGPGEPDVIAAVIEFDEDLADTDPLTQYRVTGRGFTALEKNEPEDEETGDVAAADEPPRNPDFVDRASRYNFDELSRILADRVAGNDLPEQPAAAPQPKPQPAPEGALVSIAGETFILNRLPIGIMVFRDQQVLFANRALTDLLGYDTVDSLRAAGIGAIFPADDSASAGPVSHLLRRDGVPMPVTARLQSISWQGRPALMLSASAAEMRIGHEAAVRHFAEALAELRGEGFFEADRMGIIKAMNAAGRAALGRQHDEIAGEPISALVMPDDAAALRTFLDRPARFAETARPSVTLRASATDAEIICFAEGQAGVVTGYFGYVRHRPAGNASTPAAADDVDPSMLARISRGVRRPLNTIVGFADLIRSSAFGTMENHRYLEYARDIKTAGQEIAVLVDELDEYTRLKAGRYAPRPAELDLGVLLESCVVRVRAQASAARVLVRSAISERLPRIRADRASLGQAVLNLLASAIDQSPSGGSVVLSAQPEEDGSIVVNIRDSSATGTDLGERFVVFRDGVGKDGEPLAPVRSSVGLALTRSLVAVNGCKLSVDPAGTTGTLFSVTVPPDLVAQQQAI